MDAAYISLINLLIENGVFTETYLLISVIGFLILLYKFVLKPTKDRVFKIPTEDKMNEIMEENRKLELENIKEALTKIDEISEKLRNIQTTLGSDEREIKEMKKDIETIKEKLNQFQGHLMYSNRGSSLGNREL